MWKCPKGCHEDSEFRAISQEFVRVHTARYANDNKCSPSDEDSQVIRRIKPYCSICQLDVVWSESTKEDEDWPRYVVRYRRYKENDASATVCVKPRSEGEGVLELHAVLTEFGKEFIGVPLEILSIKKEEK